MRFLLAMSLLSCTGCETLLTPDPPGLFGPGIQHPGEAPKPALLVDLVGPYQNERLMDETFADQVLQRHVLEQRALVESYLLEHPELGAGDIVLCHEQKGTVSRWWIEPRK